MIMGGWGGFCNNQFLNYCSLYGIVSRFSCPHTSQQNGHTERMIRTITNMIRSILFQANCPPTYWVEALNVATHNLNILPTKTLNLFTPHEVLYCTAPTFSLLHTFGCLCYPNLSATAPYKLAPRSSTCLYPGYATHHRGYHCLDLSTRKLIVSHHVIFDEFTFLLTSHSSTESVVPSSSIDDDQPILSLSPSSPPVCGCDQLLFLHSLALILQIRLRLHLFPSLLLHQQQHKSFLLLHTTPCSLVAKSASLNHA